MTYSNPLNDPPPCHLLSWGVTYKGEPREGQQSAVWVTVWIPGELGHWEQNHCWDSGQGCLTRLAAYLREHLGFVVRTSQGWSGGGGAAGHVQDLAIVHVPVGAR